MKKLKFTFALLSMGSLILAGCKKQETVTITKGIYYLNNKTPYTLHIEARKNGNVVALLTDSVPDSTMSHFCTVLNNTGGSVGPSEFFTEFKVIAHLPGGDSTFYEGVNDLNWEFNSLTETDREYALLID